VHRCEVAVPAAEQKLCALKIAIAVPWGESRAKSLIQDSVSPVVGQPRGSLRELPSFAAAKTSWHRFG
jgi:hypothetical protein